MKKLFILLSILGVSCYADIMSSMPGMAATSSCAQSCDPGTIIKVLGVTSDKAKTLSTTACQTACMDQCFAGKINSKQSSEMSALDCKDSLKKTFSLGN